MGRMESSNVIFPRNCHILKVIEHTDYMASKLKGINVPDFLNVRFSRFDYSLALLWGRYLACPLIIDPRICCEDCLPMGRDLCVEFGEDSECLFSPIPLVLLSDAPKRED